MIHSQDQRRRFVVATLAALLSGCGGGARVTDMGPPPTKPAACDVGFVGDPTQPMQLQLITSDGTSGSFQDVSDGGDVPLSFAPQGGYLIYAGIRARNLDVCGVQLSAVLRDIDSGVALGVDARPVNLQEGTDGWWLPDVSDQSSLNNIGVCPDFQPTDVAGHMYMLEIVVTDRNGRGATVTSKVVPRCPPDATDCQCLCAAGYVLGKCG